MVWKFNITKQKYKIHKAKGCYKWRETLKIQQKLMTWLQTDLWCTGHTERTWYIQEHILYPR